MIECPHSLYFFRGDVDNLDITEAVNTLRDWHIVPLGRPVIAPPKQKLTQIDIPGANGVLDLSNSLTKYPVFENRTGTMTFAVLNDTGFDWVTTYTKIMRFLQGNNVRMIMEDDPKYFYEGRVYVDKWDSKSDGTWSEVTLGYDFYPYRLSIDLSTEENWLWDPFNFETDFIQSSMFNAMQINTSEDEWDEKDFTGLIDIMPVIPEFTVDSFDDQPIKAQLYNSDLGYNWIDIELPDSETPYKVYNCILCEATPESVVKMRFQGQGQITMKFRSGRL